MFLRAFFSIFDIHIQGYLGLFNFWWPCEIMRLQKCLSVIFPFCPFFEHLVLRLHLLTSCITLLVINSSTDRAKQDHERATAKVS